MSDETETTERAFVLGLDGIPWYFIERWAEAGDLPNFARCIEEGAAGSLESTTPASTPLAWPSIATGVWPDKHGIYEFRKLNSNYTHEIYTSGDLKQPALWNVLSPAVVGNVPMTYPAETIDGTVVAGMMSPEINDRYTSPPELAREIEERIPDYRISLNWGEYAGKRNEFLRDIGSLLDARRKLMKLLMRTDDWRLFFFVYTAPDRLQHLVWEEDVILTHYQKLDEILGEVMAYADEHDANLFVVSDHGFGPISKYVCVNHFLEKQGYLTRKGESDVRGRLGRLGLTKDRVTEVLDRLGIDEGRIANTLPQSVVDSVANQIPGDHLLYDVDFARTAAFVYGFGNLYVNDTERFDSGIVDPSAIDDLKAKLATLFSDLRDPETGERALAVSDGDEVFPNDERSPDLVIEPTEGYEIKSSLSDRVFLSTGQKAASHRKDGIFLARGPAIQAGTEPRDAAVVDLAPTLLHSVGRPIPENTDGRVLEEILTPTGGRDRSVERQNYATSAEPKTAEVDDDFGDVEDRLKGLGYME